MSEVIFHWKEVLWTPNSYTANSVEEVFNVGVGDMVGIILVRTVVAFNGTGTAAIFELGDDGDVDRFLDAGELEEESISAATSFVRAIGATGGGYILYRNHLYTAANTIDVNFTAATGADGTAGAVMIKAAIARNVWIA